MLGFTLAAVAIMIVLVGLIAAVYVTFTRLLPVLIAGPFTTVKTAAPLTTIETVICGAALGVFAGFVHSFGLAAPWPALLQFATVAAAAYGVNVITGPAFANLFKLPSTVLLLVTLALGGVEIGAPYFGTTSTVAGIISGAVAFALSLGFGTQVTAAAAARSRA